MGSVKRRLGDHWICGATWIILQRTLLLFMLQAVEVFSNRIPANLTATDAYPVLGGYVVPVNGSITLHCEAQGPPNTHLHWNIALGSYSMNDTNAELFAVLFSNKFTHVQPNVDNPDILRIHNLQISENKSTVQCLVINDNLTKSQVITIYVEGIPDCVENLNTSSNDTSHIVSWNSYNGLLPVVYNISIWSTSNEVVMSESTVHPMIHFDSNVDYLQSNTTYFVLVTTCNSAGCSQDCDNTSIHTGPGDLHKPNVDNNSTKVDDTSTSLSGGTLIFIITPVAVAVFIIILTVVVLLSWCVVWRRQGKSKQRDHQEEHFTTENRCNLKSQTVCQNGTMEEYATVSDAKENRHLPSSPLSVQSSTPQNVVDMEGYGVVQNAAKSPQKVRSLGSQRHRVTSDVPEPMHYAEVNDCCAQTKPPLSRSRSNPQHHTVATPTTSLPPEYAEVPDTIRTRPPVQRPCSIPTTFSIEEGPPIPPRGYIQSPETSEVIDAGYASLPHQNAPSRVTKVRSSKQGGSGSPHFSPEGTVA